MPALRVRQPILATALALALLAAPGVGQAQIRVPGLSPGEPDRVAIFTIRGGGTMPPLVAFQERARQTFEAHLNAEIVSLDELLSKRASLQQELKQCQGEPKCFANLLGGTIDARYLLILTANFADETKLLGARIVDLKQLTVVGEAVDEVPSEQSFLEAIPARIQASVPPDWWDPFGALSIVINEAGAQVSVNGRIIGTSPVSNLGFLLPGEYRVSASKTGFNPAEGVAVVPRRGEGKVSLSLAAVAQAESSSSLPLILGIGGAVVVGAAATVAIVLATGGSAAEPSFCSAPTAGACP